MASERDLDTSQERRRIGTRAGFYLMILSLPHTYHNIQVERKIDRKSLVVVDNKRTEGFCPSFLSNSRT